jgi:6-phosphogluconolactonase
VKPEIRTFHDTERLSRHAVNLFIEEANRAIREQNRFLVALNGGSSPTRLFQLLASEYRDQVEWSKIHVFWGDERCVPPEDGGSNFRQANDELLSKVPIPKMNIHRVRGELEPLTAANEYAETLKLIAANEFGLPQFDLVYLGMGEDGHTASLFPGSPVDVTEPVVAVTVNYQDRPANRVTLTQLVFNRARMVVFMVSG